MGRDKRTRQSPNPAPHCNIELAYSHSTTSTQHIKNERDHSDSPPPVLSQLRTTDEEGSSVSRMQRIESARAAWRNRDQSRLEESWMSLDLFDRLQRGRLSVDLQGTSRVQVTPGYVQRDRPPGYAPDRLPRR